MKIQETAPPPTKTKERRLFLSSRDIKGMVDKIVVAGLRANPVTVGLIQQDTNAIKKFFSQKTESTDQYCQVLVSRSSSSLSVSSECSLTLQGCLLCIQTSSRLSS
jgi:hypothetical protein